MADYKRDDPVIAEELYAELYEAFSLVPDYHRAYQVLGRAFQRCLNEKTNFASIRFGGAFAKTDYLLKEYHAPRRLQRTVNDARGRLRKQWTLTEEERKENFLYDLKAISQFVALVFRAPVPSKLEARFPQDRIVGRGELKTECLRIVVNSWDDTFLYADADQEGIDDVKVFYGGKNALAIYREWDWSYLGEMLKEGCQMNLVRPREVDGVLYPELYVWEPDYLVDISAVAACFESYAASPLNHLLNKLKPSASTQPIVLGNLASQFLDESLYDYPEGRPYNESVKKFFKGNAVSLLTAGLDGEFHQQAKNQKQNIVDTLGKTLPEILPGRRMDSSSIMVEPSFFSEMLGLQGRMDFLELNQKVVIEQKSGKGGYPQKDPDTPVYQEKHYVQLLLYMLLLRYNFRSTYERNNRELQAFLFYSRYKHGLLPPLGFAPDLVFEAIKMRNRIAAAEYGYSREGLGLLTTLTAEGLNEKHVKGVLWERYQKPQIEALLSPVREASELERTYYLRFLRFLETEHLMAKVGSQTKENSGFADKWYSALDEKLLAGNIYCDLELLQPRQADCGRVDRIVLGFSDKSESDISNFRCGDIVIVYPYNEGEEPDARRTMVFRATIEQITAATLVLNLRAAQVDAHAFWHQGERKWAVEHDFFDSSFSSLYRGMHAFLSAPKARRDLLLLQREPQTDQSVTLAGDYGPFNPLVLKAMQAQDLFLIIGPPGTGKTSFGLLNILQEELLSTTESVLLLSYTNRAVDEICNKLIESHIDFIRIGGKFSCEETCRPYLLDAKVEACSKLDQLKDLIQETRVFVGTTTAFNSNVNLFRLKQFGLAIIDEASQILEPHLTGILSAMGPDGGCAIRKMVLIGDHKQLPAVVQQKEEESAVDAPILQAIHLTNCRLSLFERLLKQYRDNPSLTFMLTRQGRMHHDIAVFPNEAFYQGRLQEVPLVHQTESLSPNGIDGNGIASMLKTRRIAFVSVPATPHAISDKVNRNEAEAIAATVMQIYRLEGEHFNALQTVGVIVPYRNQIAEIRSCLDAYNMPVLRTISIDTVERYQGSQRDYILYGFTIQKHYQLNFLTENVFEEDGNLIDRKLNVAMTRARKHLLLFGNPDLLAGDAVFRRLMEFIGVEHGCFNVSLDDYLAGRFKVLPLGHHC